MKSTDRTVDLGPRTLVLGPVWSGKTTLLEAVRFLGLGTVRSPYRDVEVTELAMRGQRMSVEATLDDGRILGRTLVLDGGKLRSEATASWMPDGGATEVSNAIRSLFGATAAEAAEHLDVRGLLRCSAGERAKRIERLLDATAAAPEALAARGRALAVLRLAEVDPGRLPADPVAARGVADGCLALLDPATREAADELLPAFGEKVIAGGLGVGAVFAAEGKRDEAAGVRQKIAARAELENRLATLGVPTESAQAIGARRDEAVGRVASARSAAELTENIAAIRRNAEKAIPSLRALVAEREADRDRAQAELAGADQIEREAEALVDPPEVAAPRYVVLSDEEKARLAGLRKAVDGLEREAAATTVPVQISTEGEEIALAAAEKALGLAGKSPWRRVEEIARTIGRRRILAETAQELLALAVLNGGDVEQMTRDRDGAAAALASKRAAAAERQVEIEVAGRLRKGLRDRTVEARQEASLADDEAADRIAAENASLRSEYDHRRQMRQAEVDRIAAKRREARLRVERIRDAARRAQAALDEARATLKGAEERLAGVRSVTVDPTAGERLAAARIEVEELDGLLARATAGSARRAEMEALVGEIDRATARQKVFAALDWTCGRLREEDVAARGRGLEARASVFLRGAGLAVDPYLRTGRGVVDFGWRRDGVEKPISVETLSGAEGILYLASLGGAVTASRAPELPVLLIEAAEVGSGAALEALLRGCDAISGTIGNIVLATCNLVVPPAGWTVVDLGTEG